MNFLNEELESDSLSLSEFLETTCGMAHPKIEFDEMWAGLETSPNQIISEESVRLDVGTNDGLFNFSQSSIECVFQQCEISGSCSPTFNDLLAYVHPGDSQGRNDSQNVNEEIENQVDVPVTPPLPSPTDIPSNVDWPGEYNFHISFGQQEKKITKGSTWIYSEKLDKLFAMIGKESPVRFNVNGPVPRGSFIRALPIYSQAQHIFEVVRRCPTHMLATEATNTGHEAPEYLVRCQSDNSFYQTCPVTGRMSVVMPFSSPQPGTDFVTGLYSIMCYTSCAGSINRRAIQIVFTLEHNGIVIGRRALKVRPCACPKRDKDGEEEKKDEAKRKAVPKLKRQNSDSSASRSFVLEVDQIGPVSTKRRREEHETAAFHIPPVKKRDHYEILMRIRSCLELEDAVNERRSAATSSQNSRPGSQNSQGDSQWNQPGPSGCQREFSNSDENGTTVSRISLRRLRVKAAFPDEEIDENQHSQ